MIMKILIRDVLINNIPPSLLSVSSLSLPFDWNTDWVRVEYSKITDRNTKALDGRKIKFAHLTHIALQGIHIKWRQEIPVLHN